MIALVNVARGQIKAFKTRSGILVEGTILLPATCQKNKAALVRKISQRYKYIIQCAVLPSP